jgi:hypothetical protein
MTHLSLIKQIVDTCSFLASDSHLRRELEEFEDAGNWIAFLDRTVGEESLIRLIGWKRDDQGVLLLVGETPAGQVIERTGYRVPLYHLQSRTDISQCALQSNSDWAKAAADRHNLTVFFSKEELYD